MASLLPMETTNFDARHERFSTPLPRERFSPVAGFCLLRLCCPLAKSDARGGQYQCN